VAAGHPERIVTEPSESPGGELVPGFRVRLGGLCPHAIGLAAAPALLEGGDRVEDLAIEAGQRLGDGRLVHG
jgi:hypothetical protein